MKGFHLLDDSPDERGSPRCVRGSDSDSGGEGQAHVRNSLVPPTRPHTRQPQHTQQHSAFSSPSGSSSTGDAAASPAGPSSKHAGLKAVPARRFRHTRRPGRPTQQLPESSSVCTAGCCSTVNLLLQPISPRRADGDGSSSTAALARSPRPQQQRQQQQLPVSMADVDHLVVTRVHAAGICCPMEARLIHRILDGLPGVADVQVTVVTKVVAVQHNPAALSPAAVAAALNGAGLQATLMASASSCAPSPMPPVSPDPHGRHQEGEEGPVWQQQDWLGAAWARRPSWVPPLTVVLCGLLVLLSMLSLLPLPGFRVFEVLALVAAAVGVPPVLRKAYHGLRAGIVDMNTLLLVALVGAIGLNDWSEAGTLVFLFTLAEWMEERCVGRAAHALEDMLRLQPDQATLIDETGSTAATTTPAGGCTEGCCKGAAPACKDPTCSESPAHHHHPPQPTSSCCADGSCSAVAAVAAAPGGRPIRAVPAGSIAAGMLVLVRPGDKVPVDGLVEEGASVLDESMLTGESRPVAKNAGSQVMAGTVNCGGSSLEVRATAAAADSTVARLSSLIAEASAAKGKRDRFVEVFAKYYTPAVMALAALIVVGGVAADAARWRHWCYTALVVLVTACPCALVISTPVASVAGIACAAKKGVLIKGSRYLELLGSVRAISFDKSGTLTQGHFQIMSLKLLDARFDEQHVLRYAAALEQHSSHPLAPAVVGYAAAQGCVGGVTAQRVQVVAGKGVVGEVDGHVVALGSWKYAQDLMNPPPATPPQRQHLQLTVASSPTHQAATLPVTPRSPAPSAAELAMSPNPQRGAPKPASGLVIDTLGMVSLVGGPASPTTPSTPPDRSSSSLLSLVGAGATSSPGSSSIASSSSATNRLELAAVEKLLQQWAGRGASTVCVVVDGSLVALLVLCDQLRRDATAAVAELQALGCYCAMLSGDSMAAATAIALELGMEVEQVYAELLPSDKLQVLTMLQRSHVTVAHVGDGINDAPALAAADVGVAMGVAGSALAVDTADVALFTNDLQSLVFAVALGRRVGQVVISNITLACAIKVAVLVAAAAGYASLWLSLLADVGASLLVTLHALTLLRFNIGWQPTHVVTPPSSPPPSRPPSRRDSDSSNCRGPASKAGAASSATGSRQQQRPGAPRAQGRWQPVVAVLEPAMAKISWWRGRRYQPLSEAGGPSDGTSHRPRTSSSSSSRWQNGSAPWPTQHPQQQQQGIQQSGSRDLELGSRSTHNGSPRRTGSSSPGLSPRRQSPRQQQQQEQHSSRQPDSRRVPAAMPAASGPLSPLFVLEDE